MMSLSTIVAMDLRGTIGRKGALPWHLPSDLQRFKKLTTGHPVIMGRTTFDSIFAKLGKALPDRTNLVLTSSSRSSISEKGATACASIEEALERAQRADGAGEIFVLGGRMVYGQLLPMSYRLYVTQVGASVEGDTCFPRIKWSEWSECLDERKLISTKQHPKDEYESSFCVYERK